MFFKAKKSLGQNFLVDDEIIQTILECSKIKDKYILEIGPGTGNLTRKILEHKPKKLYLIEKDNYLLEQLKNELKYEIVYMNDDILNVNTDKRVKHCEDNSISWSVEQA